MMAMKTGDKTILNQQQIGNIEYRKLLPIIQEKRGINNV